LRVLEGLLFRMRRRILAGRFGKQRSSRMDQQDSSAASQTTEKQSGLEKGRRSAPACAESIDEKKKKESDWGFCFLINDTTEPVRKMKRGGRKLRRETLRTSEQGLKKQKVGSSSSEREKDNMDRKPDYGQKGPPLIRILHKRQKGRCSQRKKGVRHAERGGL